MWVVSAGMVKMYLGQVLLMLPLSEDTTTRSPAAV